ncbi:chain length regulator (capsular polysaccharide biosynthesis) [Weissella koreensis KACC 15510]|uniref:YveK family protein n=1 Tax=Weissella koreensis TaxID=165096 RepID=UPI00021758CF|nr:Wzz/FepE/Etk N-terminal domain-containing protein [Weissella koreensis]AEJ24143.1 chain length regulator (capsular polysaccharide biosynthesis) [Weissella koreensis KACC 15510]
MNNTIDLTRIWVIIRRHMELMIVMGVVFGAIAFGVSKFMIQPEYSSSASLLVNRKQDGQNGGTQYADQQADVQLINTYKDIITRPIILNEVVDSLTKTQQIQTKKGSDDTPDEYKEVPGKYTTKEINADTLGSMISVSNQQNSQIFSITVKSDNAKMSKDIANAIAKTFKNKVASIMSISNVSIVSKATVKNTPVSPNVKLITLAGLILGVLIGFIWGVIRELTDRTVKDVDFLTDELQLINLGKISYVEGRLDIEDGIAIQNEMH